MFWNKNQSNADSHVTLIKLLLPCNTSKREKTVMPLVAAMQISKEIDSMDLFPVEMDVIFQQCY